MASLSLSIIEIIVLMLGAIILGITIHFFITSQRNLKGKLTDTKKNTQPLNDWKLRYFNDIEARDKELAALRNEQTTLREQLSEIKDNDQINVIEAEELRKLNKKLQAELEASKKAATVQHQQVLHTTHTERPDYFEQLKEAQSSLMEHNEKINQLLSNIDVIKETEEKQQVILRDNEELHDQVENLRSILDEKDSEINDIRQKAQMSKEMTSMLDNAYAEFGSLQEKIHKLESQANNSKLVNLEYEDLKEGHLALKKEFDEQKLKLTAMVNENRELKEDLSDTQDSLRETNMQRQQLQKRVSYLEELNHDLQMVSDANKRLEGQIKRIGELESKLNLVSEERDKLIRRQV